MDRVMGSFRADEESRLAIADRVKVELESRINALEKENAELKARNGEIMARHCDVMNLLIEENQQLKKIFSVRECALIS